MDRHLVNSEDMIERLGGFDVQVAGVTWDPPESETESVQSLFDALAKHLFAGIESQSPESFQEWCLELCSYVAIMAEKTDPQSPLAKHLKAMKFEFNSLFARGTCESYWIGDSFTPEAREIFIPLEIRIGLRVAALALTYGVEPNRRLHRILPPSRPDLGLWS